MAVDRRRRRAATYALDATTTGCSTGVGPFTITRDAATGGAELRRRATAPTATLDTERLRRADERRVLDRAATTRYALALDARRGGRITAATETIAGGAPIVAPTSTTPHGQLTTRHGRDGATRRGLRLRRQRQPHVGRVRRSRRADRDLRRAGPDLQTAAGRSRYAFDADGFLHDARRATRSPTAPRGELLQRDRRRDDRHLRLRRRRAGSCAHARRGERPTFLYGNPGNAVPGHRVASTRAARSRRYFYDDDDCCTRSSAAATRYRVGTDQVGTPRVVVDARRHDRRARSTTTASARVLARLRRRFELPFGFAGGLERPGHRARALRPARLRPGRPAASPPATRALRRQPGQPLRLRGQRRRSTGATRPGCGASA